MIFPLEMQNMENDRKYLIALADCLDDAHRYDITYDDLSELGSLGYIRISDELAVSLAERVREIGKNPGIPVKMGRPKNKTLPDKPRGKVGRPKKSSNPIHRERGSAAAKKR